MCSLDRKENRFLDFELARDFVRNLSIKSKIGWKKYTKIKPSNIPSSPERVYKKFWISWNDWLGNNNRFCGDKKIIKYKEAIIISKSLNIKSKKEWEKFMFKVKRIDLPRKPDIYYKEWVSWSEWLGIESRSDKNFMSLVDLKDLLKKNNIKKRVDFNKFYKTNIQIPSYPIIYYKLSSWRELFDIDFKKIEYLGYFDSKNEVHKMNIKSQKLWYILCKKNIIPKNIPKTPNKFYKEWISWNDWLGHTITPFKKFLKYEEGREYLKKINLSSLQEYHDYVVLNKLDFLPLNPITYYNSNYISSEDFLSYSDERISYGEKKIKEYLEYRKIEFYQQEKFDGCFNVKPLLFDFYLPKLNLCIEFDGKQHFECIEYFGGINGYIRRKENDIIKNGFCNENNIKLLRISYEDINIISNILESELNVNNV